MEDARALKTGSSKNILTMSDCNSILTPVFKVIYFPLWSKRKYKFINNFENCDACDERGYFEGCRYACFLIVADVGTTLPVA